jgi:hypothetical protein
MMYKNKHKSLYYSLVMYDLYYVGKQRDEIKNVNFTEIQIQFMKFVFITLAIHEKSGDPRFRKKKRITTFTSSLN